MCITVITQLNADDMIKNGKTYITVIQVHWLKSQIVFKCWKASANKHFSKTEKRTEQTWNW